ncbi:ribonucleotide-diphosphate reductase subunit beta [Paenibacillus sp. GCM10027627]|uniref:ribonucleotide-diphosphate reductase subunit beta n=1 Tax=unclassified Paenibacillus TaxID=185978 RepID=UPI003630F867
MNISPFKIFNAEKSNLPTKIFGGEASGIRDWDNIKYPTMLDMNKAMFAEYWIEDEIKLGKDIEQYNTKLSDRERYVYNILTGMLNTLDSVATDFNMFLSFVTTDTSVRSNIALINAFEVLHNRSYQYLTSTMLSEAQKKEAFEEIKDIPVLQERNKFLFDKIQKFVDVTTEYIVNKKKIDDYFLQVTFEAILANQCLEGVSFTAAFVYFHSLARDQKMIGSNNLVVLIKGDEVQHSEFYGTLVRAMMGEYPQLNTEVNQEYAVNFLREYVEMEKIWAKYIFKGIETFSLREYNNYVEYLANLIARNAGFTEPFPENKELKSRWIVTYGSKKRDSRDSKQIVTRSDFLQTDAPNYEHSSGEDYDY